MALISSLLKDKGGEVFSITPDESVFEAMKAMSVHGIGALMVVDDGNLAGVLSERDYARKVILQDRSSRTTRVAEIMSTDVVEVPPSASVDQCMMLMTDKRIRHLPVIDDNKLVGVISIGDLVSAVIADQKNTIEQLQHYIAG